MLLNVFCTLLIVVLWGQPDVLGTFREGSEGGNGAGSGHFCIQDLFALSVQDLQVSDTCWDASSLGFL